MASFTNDPQPTNDPNYLGQFKGYDRLQGNTGLGTLFSGIGEIGGESIQAAGTLIKADAEKFLEKRLGAVREDFGGETNPDVAQETGKYSKGVNPLTGAVDSTSGTDENAQSGGIFGGPKGPVKGAPAGVQKLGSKVERLHDAYQNGQMSDSYYDAKLEAVVREAKARYPGFTEEVDQITSRITGITPANALRRSILSDLDNAQRAANSGGNKWNTFLTSNGAEIAMIYGRDGAERIAANTPNTAQQAKIYSEVMNLKAVNLKNDMTIKNINVAKDLRAAGQAQLSDSVSADASVIATTAMGQAVKRIEMQSGQPLTDQIQEAVIKGVKLDDKVAGQLMQAHNLAQLQARQQLDARLDEQDQSGRTLRMKLGIDEVNKIYAQQDNHFTHLKTGIGQGDYGIIHAWTNATTLNGNVTTHDLVQAHPAWGFVIQNGKSIGDTASNTLLMNPNLKMLPNLEQWVLGQNTRAMAGPKTQRPDSPPMMDLRDALEYNSKTNSAVLPKLQNMQIEAVPNALTSKTVNLDEKRMIAQATYADRSILSDGTFKTDNDKFSAWYKLTTPAVTESMSNEIGRRDPAKNRDYEAFVLQGGAAMVAQKANTLQEAITGRKDIQFGWDPRANQFFYKKEGTDINVARRYGGRLEHDPAVLAMLDVNKAMLNINPVLKNQRIEPGEWLTHTLGVDPNAPKVEGSILPALGGAVSKFWDKVTTPSEGEKSAPKKGEGLMQYAPENYPDHSVQRFLRSPNGQSSQVVRSPLGDRILGVKVDDIPPGMNPQAFIDQLGNK